MQYSAFDVNRNVGEGKMMDWSTLLRVIIQGK